MNWQGLAQAVIDRRIELGYRTRESFAAASSLSSRLLGDLERAERDNYDRVTLSRLEHALQWRPGRVQEILRIEPPAEDDADAGPFSLHPDAVTARVARLLAADTPLGKNMRWTLAGVLSGVLDLVDPPLPQHHRQREAEGQAMFLAAIAAHNEGMRETEQAPHTSRPAPDQHALEMFRSARTSADQ